MLTTIFPLIAALLFGFAVGHLVRELKSRRKRRRSRAWRSPQPYRSRLFM
jgi:uncharacterized membrane protein